MQAAHEPEPHHRVLHRKLKDSFAANCLTVLSVIQGLALEDLAFVVAAEYQKLTLTQWLLVVLNFALVIIIWDAYMIQSILWEWVPDMRDAAIPFAFGALELVLNHTIGLSLSAWLLALALLSGLVVLANWHAGRRARKEAENTTLLSLLGSQTRGQVLYLGWSLVLLGLALASRMGSVEASESLAGLRGGLALALVLLVGVGTAVIGLTFIRFWSRIVTYARTGHLPGREEAPS